MPTIARIFFWNGAIVTDLVMTAFWVQQVTRLQLQLVPRPKMITCKMLSLRLLSCQWRI